MATKTNVEINGKKYFRITRTIGHKTVDGKRVPIKKQFLGRSKGDAEHKYAEWIKEQERIRHEKQRELDVTTFGERAEDYVANVLRMSQKYAEGTKARYEQSWRTHIKGSFLADIPAKDVRAADIQEFYNGLDVSQQNLRNIHKFLSAYYKWLVLNDYADNVLAAVEIPKKPDASRHDSIIVWTDEELHAILSSISGHRLCFLVHVLLYTGMRISEALGLKYGDVDGDVIHIRRQMYRGEEKPPKFGSVRDIPMHKDLAATLPIHRAWHEKEGIPASDLVFTTETGLPYDYTNVRRSLVRFYKSIGIEPKHIHAYRSTFCTQLCKCGVPLEVASKLLGHKSLEVTAAHYALVRPETQRAAIDMLHYDF